MKRKEFLLDYGEAIFLGFLFGVIVTGALFVPPNPLISPQKKESKYDHKWECVERGKVGMKEVPYLFCKDKTGKIYTVKITGDLTHKSKVLQGFGETTEASRDILRCWTDDIEEPKQGCTKWRRVRVRR